MTSEADGGGMASEVELPTNIPLYFVTVRQMAAEGQCDKMASDMEVHVKKGVLLKSSIQNK